MPAHSASAGRGEADVVHDWDTPLIGAPLPQISIVHSQITYLQ